MIITEDSIAKNNTGLNSKNYKIKASNQAFKILSSSLYENKPKAVLREISANALDSHIAAGIPDTPITITLPTSLSPSLVVQDYGTGLSMLELESIYTTYFESTKQKENSSIGGFGLGSKSPFSISEAFTVTSVKDGEYTQIVNYTDQGSPKFIVLDHNLKTDLPNGTKIEIPVEDSELISKLKKEANTLFSLWDTQPTINNTNTTEKEFTLIDTYKDSFKFLQTKEYSVASYRVSLKSFFNNVSVGPFIYSVPDSMLEEMEAKYSKDCPSIQNKLKVIYKALTSKSKNKHVSIVLTSKIGDLELAPSRERIENTIQNKKFIFNKFKKEIEELYTTLKSKSKVLEKDLVNYLKSKEFSRLHGFKLKDKIKISKELNEKYKNLDVLYYILYSEYNDSTTHSKELPEYVKLTSNLYNIRNNPYESADAIFSSIYGHDSISGYDRVGIEKVSIDTISNYKLTSLHTNSNNSSIHRHKNYKVLETINNAVNNKTPLYLMTSELTNKDKSIINAIMRNSSSSYHITLKDDPKINQLMRSNYFELKVTTDTAKNLFKAVNNLYIENPFVAITMQDILDSYNITPIKKASSKSSTYGSNKTSLKDVVVGEVFKASIVVNSFTGKKQLTCTGVKDITVDQLYKNNNIEKDSAVFIFNKADTKAYYFKVLYDYLIETAFKPFLLDCNNIYIITLNSKEFNTVRYEKFLNKKHDYKLLTDIKNSLDLFENHVPVNFPTAYKLLKINLIYMQFYSKNLHSKSLYKLPESYVKNVLNSTKFNALLEEYSNVINFNVLNDFCSRFSSIDHKDILKDDLILDSKNSEKIESYLSTQLISNPGTSNSICVTLENHPNKCFYSELKSSFNIIYNLAFKE